MGLIENLQKLIEKEGLSRYKLAKETGIPYTTLIKIMDGTTKNPQIESLSPIADYFKVSVDHLIGESASSIIEAKLEERSMTLAELAEKANVPLTFLQNLDNIVPDHEVDGGEQCYIYISSIAWILDIPGSKLRTAFARQEIPASEYPDTSPVPIEEEFEYEDFGQSDTPVPNKNVLTPKDERDIARDLERMLSNLESNEALAFDGEPLDDETKELMRISLENSMRIAKQLAKKKFTPDRYK